MFLIDVRRRKKRYAENYTLFVYIPMFVVHGFQNRCRINNNDTDKVKTGITNSPNMLKILRYSGAQKSVLSNI